MIGVGKMEAFTRAGFAARGVMYCVIGFLALWLDRMEDGAGAMKFLQGGAGSVVLAAMAAGFLAYGIWRLTEALIDTENHGDDAKGWAVRAGGAVSGLIHVGLSFAAAAFATSKGGGSGDGAREGAATALSFPGGELALGVAAAGLAATGAYQLLKAWNAGFLKRLDREASSRPWVMWLGRAGYAARGIVFMTMAWFFWQAARESSAGEAGGMGAAMEALPNALQILVAAGLLLFGLFSFVEARYRRINDPHVIERLKRAAA